MLPLRFLRIADRGTPRSFTIPACLLLLASAPLWLAGCDESPAHAASAPPAATASPHREGADIVVPADSPLRERLVVDAVRSQAVEQPIAAPGTIEALPDHLARIAPPVTGRVVGLHRALGDPVRAGDVLFTLDSSDLSAARGDAAKARDAAAQAGRDLDRQQLLFDADIAARKDLEAAQLARAQAANDLRTAQARLAQLGASADDNAGRRLSVRAPLAGRVIEMNAAPGGYWNDVNAPLMTIADLSRVSVTAAVPEKDLARIFVGQSAQVVLNAYPDDPRAGTVRYIGEVLDPDTRTVKVRLILDNADGRLRPGMFVKLRFAGPSHPAPVVPASALLQEGLFTRVFVERAPGRYVAREVSVGAALGDQVEIVSGLRPGERVVVRDGVLLHD